jgi:cobalt-zinc-cadmium efflux system membrane fusion protein
VTSSQPYPLRPVHWPTLFASAVLLLAPATYGMQTLGCLITPSNVIEIGSPLTGVVEQLHVERGDNVSPRQVLATLRADVEQANLRLARLRARANAELTAAANAHEFAQNKLERVRNLYRQEFLSRQAVEQAEAEAKDAEGRLAGAREQSQQAQREYQVAAAQLESRRVRSPVHGVVADIYRRSGERVEDRPILKVVTLDPLYVEIVLPASLFGRVAAGTAVTVRPDVPGATTVPGRIHLVDRLLDPASHTFRARVVLPNPDEAIPAGTRCLVEMAAGGNAPVASSSGAAASGTAAPRLSDR